MKPASDVYKYKPKPTNNLRHLLDDSVLDDETRKMLMKDVLQAKRPTIPLAAQPGASPSTQQPQTQTTGTSTHQNPAPSSLPTSASKARPLQQQQQQHPQPHSDHASNTEDLLVVMTQRLRTLEAQAVVMQKELKDKNRRIIEWEDKYKAERVERLKLVDANDELTHQVAEMTSFLADYGLTWVGGSATSSPSVTPRGGASKHSFNLYDGAFQSNVAVQQETPASSNEHHPPPHPALATVQGPSSSSSDANVSGTNATKKTQKRSSLPFDLSLLQRNAEILSAHVGCTEIASGDNPQMKVIRERNVVYVCVYSDGICVNSGPFRPYGWPLCDAILQDILEGFYPYEFKEKYPDGFPISIVDKSTEGCPLQALQTDSNVNGVQSTNDHGYKPLTRDAFLKRLPERYITANGHLVQVRDTMTELLSGGTAVANVTLPMSTITAQTAASRQLSVDNTTATSGPSVEVAPSGNSNISAIQIKLPTGQKVILHMFFTDTIERVRRELEKAAPVFRPPQGYELATVFPRKTYEEHNLTLEQLGLVPNCTMMIKMLSTAPQ